MFALAIITLGLGVAILLNDIFTWYLADRVEKLEDELTKMRGDKS